MREKFFSKLFIMWGWGQGGEREREQESRLEPEKGGKRISLLFFSREKISQACLFGTQFLA